jgi:hypothetical protein
MARKRKWTDEQLTDAVSKSRSVSDVLKYLGTTSRPIVVKRMEELELSLPKLGPRKRARKWTDEQLAEAVKESRYTSEVLQRLGTTNRAAVLKRIKELDLDASRLESRPSGINIDGSLNTYWRKFKERLDKYDETPVSNWSKTHLLGHILKRYKDQMGMEFSLSYSGPPTKSKEIYCVRRILLALGTDNPHIAKQYIDWVYDTVIIPKRVDLVSIAYFFIPAFILRFKAELRKQNRITRATELPLDIQNLAVGLDLDVRTYGDLALAKVAIEDDPENEDLDVYSRLFIQLKEAGFDESVLSSLEG